MTAIILGDAGKRARTVRKPVTAFCYKGWMGQNNKSRRAAKSKKRRQEARRSPQHESSHDHYTAPPPTDGDMVMAAVHAERIRDVSGRDFFVGLLLQRPSRRVAAELQEMLELQVSWIWESGWQPADVVRLAAKKLGDREADLLRCAVAADAAGYEQWGAAVSPDWVAQLVEIETTRWWDPAMPWPLQMDGEWRQVLLAGVRLLNLLGVLPEVPILMPPPSQWPSAASSSRSPQSHLAPGILAKVRALLAKAESTSFDAEAEAFTAKAQELMTRHRIDRVTVGADDPGEEATVGRRVGIDSPYSEAKTVLLAGIAEANGCRTVWSKDLGFVTVFGYAAELDGVEELFTSLLVQATTALQREGSKSDRFGRSRTTRFRRSFLVAFGGRISQRLRDTTDDTVRSAEAERGAPLLPVLASRARAADKAVERAFPGISELTVSATDTEGYRSGIRFADEADLGTVSPGDDRTLVNVGSVVVDPAD